MSLYEQLSDALENDPPESAQEVLLNAAFLFEKAVLSSATQDPQDFARSMGWPPEVIDQETSEAGVHLLRDALTRFIHRWMEHPSAGLAVWALGKLHYPGLKPLFDEVLEHHLERDPNLLYQALIALQNLGIRLPGEEQGMSVYEVERNRVMARSYRLQPGESLEAFAQSTAPVESILRLLQELVRTPSRGGLDAYDSAITLVRHWLDGQGVSSEVLMDERGQPVALHARVGQGSPSFVLNAPLDTASYGDEARWTHPPASGLLQDGWLHGRGSGDSKSAVAIFCHIAAALHRRRLFGKGSVELLFDADEHTGRLGGMRAWLARRPEGVAGVFIGYPGDERIMIGSRGFWRARLRVHGEPGHSGAGRRKATNALSQAALLVRALEAAPLPQQMREDFPLPPKLTVTGVRGGGDFALVPDSAIVEVDLRLTPVFEAAAAEALVRDAVRKVDEARPGPRSTEIEVLPGWPAYVLSPESGLARALQRSVEEVRGTPIPLEIAGPSNTGNLLATQGIPATCGFGVRYRNIHAPDEAIDVSTLGPTYRAYLGALELLLDDTEVPLSSQAAADKGRP
ncbi:M20 family metallopeptidase [Hyalangium sp.]|uniref:M20 family metallopeptidase n=1 Tax=Hyalangium sp. TaxID=2028555 RepID=UPI002D3FEC45|nr:M20 family metallopeptidase [Hyalangium sp.]HYH98290.1 M20 family metallopeptidase [Hyalangium sp.]